MSVAAIILAAGASRRLGRPKQQVVLAGETLLERAVRVAMEAGLAPVMVVVAPGAGFVETLRKTACLIVENVDAEEGMAASIRTGVRAVQDAEGVIVMTCDQPLLRPEHLRALSAEPVRVTASEYAGRRGVPAYFPQASFPELLQLCGDAGAREALRSAATVVDESLALDVDTEEDVAKAERRLAGGLIR